MDPHEVFFFLLILCFVSCTDLRAALLLFILGDHRFPRGQVGAFTYRVLVGVFGEQFLIYQAARLSPLSFGDMTSLCRCCYRFFPWGQVCMLMSPSSLVPVVVFSLLLCGSDLVSRLSILVIRRSGVPLTLRARLYISTMLPVS